MEGGRRELIVAAVGVLGEDATAEHLASVTDLGVEDVRDAVRELVDGDIATGGDVVNLRSVDAAPAARTAVGREAVALLHRRAAAALHRAGSPEEVVAAHLLECPPVREPWAIEVLRLSARRRRSGGDPDAAAALLRRALDERPTASERPRVLLDLARVERLVEPEAAIGRLREVLPLLDDPRERLAARLQLARCLAALARVYEALEEADVAAREAPTDADRLRADLAFTSLARLSLDTRPTGRARLALLESRLRTTDPATVDRAVFAEIAYEQALEGATDHREVIATALASFGGESLEGVHDIPLFTGHVAALALLWCGELRTVERASDLVIARARRRGATADLGSPNAWRANATLRRGRLDDCIAASDVVMSEFSAILPGSTGLKAIALALKGESGAMRTTLELPGGEEAWQAIASYQGYLIARARALLLAGDHEGAYRAAQECGTLAAVMGTINPAVLAWRSTASEAAAALGHEDVAQALADDELRLARRFGEPASVARGLRGVARLREPAAALPMLREADALVAPTADRLEHVFVQLDLAQALLRTGDADGGRARATRAGEIAGAMGATVLARRAAEVLEARRRPAGGPRPPSVAASIVELRALGGFTAIDAAGHDVTPRGLPAKAVRIVVAAARSLHAEELADRLWDEPLAPEQVKARLPNLMARSRTPAGPLLERRGDLVALAPGVTVDADRFEAAAAAAIAATDPDNALDMAVTASLLYGGDLLPTDPYADWAALRREHLRRRYLTVSDLGARLASDAGRNELTLDLLESAIRHEPHDLERYELAIDTLETMGRVSAARAMRVRAERARDALGL